MDLLTDEQLRLLIKSIGITADVVARKLSRLSGRAYDEAVHELEIARGLQQLLSDEHTKRVTH